VEVGFATDVTRGSSISPLVSFGSRRASVTRVPLILPLVVGTSYWELEYDGAIPFIHFKNTLLFIKQISQSVFFIYSRVCMRFIRGKIFLFKSQGMVFEFCLRGNMGLFIETMKILINVKFYIKNTNERETLYKISR
jgi:hypothetical protein